MAIRTKRDEPSQTAVLRALIPRLPEPLVEEGLELALTTLDTESRNELVAAVLNRLVQVGQHHMAIRKTKELSDVGLQTAAWISVIPKLVDAGCVRETLQAVREVSDERVRTEALLSLVPHLPDLDRLTVLQEVVPTEKVLKPGLASPEVLAGLIAVVPESMREPVFSLALAAASGIRDDKRRVEFLIQLAALVPSPAVKDSDASAQADPFLGGSLSSFFGPPSPAAVNRQKVLARATDIATVMSDPDDQTLYLFWLLHLMPHRSGVQLPGETELRQRINDGLAPIENDERKARAVVRLAGLVPRADRKQVLSAAVQRVRELKPERDDLLLPLLPHLEDATRQQVLRAVLGRLSTADEAELSGLPVVELTPYLTDAQRVHLLSKCLSASHLIGDSPALALAKSTLLPHLPAAERERCASALVELAQRIPDRVTRARVLTRAAPFHPDQSWAWRVALTAVIDLCTNECFSELIADWAATAPENYITWAIGAVEIISSPAVRTKALLAVAPHLPPHLLPQAMMIASDIMQHRNWPAMPDASLLVDLALTLPSDHRRDFLAKALTVADEDERLRLMEQLAKNASSDLLPEIIALIQAIEEPTPRAQLLARLLLNMGEGIPLAAAAVIRSIEAEWGEALIATIATMPERIRDRCLGAAQVIKDEVYRARVMLKLAPFLSADAQEAVLGAVRSLDSIELMRTSAKLLCYFSDPA